MTLFTVVGLLFVISLGLWTDTMLTLALILVATIVCLVIDPDRHTRGQVAPSGGGHPPYPGPDADDACRRTWSLRLPVGTRRGAGPARDGHLRHAARGEA